MPSDRRDDPAKTGPSGVVRDRGRERALMGRALDGRSGVVALTGEEIEEVVELLAVVLAIV